MKRPLLVAAVTVLAACGGNDSRQPSLRAISVSGTNPLDGSGITSVHGRFRVENAGAANELADAEVVNGSFKLRIPDSPPELPLHVTLDFSSPSGVVLTGGTPSFLPTDATTIKVLVGTPGTCEVVPQLALPVAREKAGAILLGRYALVFGGVDAAGPSPQIDAFDLLTLEHVAVAPAATPLGATRVGLIDRGRALVAPTGSAPYIHRFPPDDPIAGRPVPTIHAGGETADAVVSTPDSGAILVSGGPLGAHAPQLSWIVPSELVAETPIPGGTLTYNAVGTETGLWLLSNDAGNIALTQLASSTSYPQIRGAPYPDGTRQSGMLFAESSGFRMLLVGGADAGGVIRGDTTYISNCPTGCGFFVGVPWTTARLGTGFDPRGVIAGGAGPSALIDQVIVEEAGPRIRPFATLVHARENPSVVLYPSGIALVFGGRDAAGLVSETEMCWPPSAP